MAMNECEMQDALADDMVEPVAVTPADDFATVSLRMDVTEDEYRNLLSDLNDEPYSPDEDWRDSFLVKIMSMIDANEVIYGFVGDDGLPSKVHAFARRRIFRDFARGFDDLVTSVGGDRHMREIICEAESRFIDFVFNVDEE